MIVWKLFVVDYVSVVVRGVVFVFGFYFGVSLVIVIRDKLDRLEPIILQSFTGVLVLRLAGRHTQREVDRDGQCAAAFSFITTYLARVFYHKYVFGGGFFTAQR